MRFPVLKQLGVGLQAQDNSLWAHGLRNAKSTTSAESTGGSAPDPVKIDQQAVLRALQLTKQQQEAILGGDHLGSLLFLAHQTP